jgi:hypothetical protein
MAIPCPMAVPNAAEETNPMATACVPRSADGGQDDVGSEVELDRADDHADVLTEAGEERDGDPIKGIVLALLLSGVVWAIIAALVA